MSIRVKLKFTSENHDPVFIRMDLTDFPHDVNVLLAYYEVAKFCEYFNLTEHIFLEEEINYIQNSITSPCFDGYFCEIKDLMHYFGEDTLANFLYTFTPVVICQNGYLMQKFTGVEIESI